MRRIPFAAPGYPFVFVSCALLYTGWMIGWIWLALLGLVGAVFFAYFFRDPERSPGTEAGAIVSPADGKVVVLDEVQEDRFLKGPAKRLGIFMRIFDVHVNRAPVAGRVSDVNYRQGRYQAANRPGADQVNEQQAILLEDREGRQVLVVQIAGLLARRIISHVKPGDRLAQGDRLGMICFGSRVDLYLPLDCSLQVQVGDSLKAGTSIVGRWP